MPIETRYGSAPTTDYRKPRNTYDDIPTVDDPPFRRPGGAVAAPPPAGSWHVVMLPSPDPDTEGEQRTYRWQSPARNAPGGVAVEFLDALGTWRAVESYDRRLLVLRESPAHGEIREGIPYHLRAYVICRFGSGAAYRHRPGGGSSGGSWLHLRPREHGLHVLANCPQP